MNEIIYAKKEERNNKEFSRWISYDSKRKKERRRRRRRKKKEEEIFRISLFKQISFLVSPRRRKWSAASGKGNSYKTKRRKGVIYSLNSDINFGLQPNAWWAVKSSFKPKGTRDPLRNDSQLPVVFSRPRILSSAQDRTTVFERWSLPPHTHDRLLPGCTVNNAPRLVARAKNRDSKWTWLPADVRTSYITITLASRQTRVESKTSVAGRPGSSFGLVSLESFSVPTEPFQPKTLYFFPPHVRVHRFPIDPIDPIAREKGDERLVGVRTYGTERRKRWELTPCPRQLIFNSSLLASRSAYNCIAKCRLRGRERISSRNRVTG